ncbi:MAG: hypothetical protein M1296_04605 [Chloroflexi bacterium]|nr:hypothetical protein [Chloroflexota bacterium]
MATGSPYEDAETREAVRLRRRFRRDLMFVTGSTYEVAATGVVAALAILPLIFVPSSIVLLLFSHTLAKAAVEASQALGVQPLDATPPPPATSSLLVALVVLAAALALSGGCSAWVRRRTYLAAGGLRRFPERVSARHATLAFFGPLWLLVVAVLVKAQLGRLPQTRSLDVVATTSVDRLVVYAFLAIVLCTITHLLWELCFEAIWPSLTSASVDTALAERELYTAQLIQAEETRLRQPWEYLIAETWRRSEPVAREVGGDLKDAASRETEQQ